MLDLITAMAARLKSLLEADGGQFFPAPGDRVTAIPTIYQRAYSPRQFNPSNIECIPGIVIYRDANIIGFNRQGPATICVLWELYNPPEEAAADADYYRLGEENLDRADSFMADFLKPLSIGDWDFLNLIQVKYGTGKNPGEQPEDYSVVEYKLTASKTRIKR